MKMFSRIALLLVLLANTLMVTPIRAAESCHVINAKTMGQFTFTSPLSGFAVADIIGGGLLQGIQTGEVTSTLISVDPPVLSQTTLMTYTTRNGTMTVLFEGTLDLSTGALSGSSVSFVSGTGKLEGATGTLSFEGLVVDVFGSPMFAHDLKGEICVDLSKEH